MGISANLWELVEISGHQWGLVGVSGGQAELVWISGHGANLELGVGTAQARELCLRAAFANMGL